MKESIISQIKKNKIYYLLLMPFLIFFIIFMLVPTISSIVLSFTDFNMVQLPHFVGFDNYLRLLFSDKIFITSLKNTLILALITGPIGYMLSFILAWLINNFDRRLRSIFTFFIYSPTLAGNVYFMWTYIFSSDRRGLLNNLLLQMKVIKDPVYWLTDAKYNFTVVIIVVLWMSFGTGFLSFISGLQTLDPVYYEAASIDGLKNRWQELYYVTFPQMGPQLLFGAVMTISSSFAIGAQCAALTGNPSTDYSTHTILLHMQDYANTRFELGYASAIAVVLFVIMLLSWFLIQKVLKQFND